MSVNACLVSIIDGSNEDVVSDGSSPLTDADLFVFGCFSGVSFYLQMCYFVSFRRIFEGSLASAD